MFPSVSSDPDIVHRAWVEVSQVVFNPGILGLDGDHLRDIVVKDVEMIAFDDTVGVSREGPVHHSTGVGDGVDGAVHGRARHCSDNGIVSDVTQLTVPTI